MLPRLDELESDLTDRRNRAAAEAWLGEIEGIDRTLQCLRDKRADALRLTRLTRQVHLGMPAAAAVGVAVVVGGAGGGLAWLGRGSVVPGDRDRVGPLTLDGQPRGHG